MPAYNREASSLPDIDEAVAPFSSLFGGSFDQATVESAAQLADNSIFVTSTGSRYRFERLPDSTVPRSNPAPAAQAPGPHGFRRRPLAVSTDGGRGGAAAGGGGPSMMRRKGSGPEPKVPTEDVTTLMGHLSVNRFGASPLYEHSDGGVQAAETLTDRISPPAPSHQSFSNRINGAYHNQNHQFAAAGTMPANYPPHPQDIAAAAAAATTARQQDYPRQQAADYGRQQQEYSYQQQHYAYQQGPANPYPYYPPVDTGQYGGGVSQPYVGGSNQPARESLPLSAVSSYPSLMEYSSPTSQTSSMVLTPASANFPAWHSPADVAPGAAGEANNNNNNNNNGIDTQTPVVVLVHPPPSSAAASLQRAPSDKASTGREHVMPGEDILYDGGVQTSANLTGPFEQGHLKAFRNTLSNDLRFHCRVGNNSETHWMKGASAQLVPMYAYDQRSREPMILIRESSNSSSNNANNNNSNNNNINGGGGGAMAAAGGGAYPSSASPQPGGAPGPCGIYQFAQLQDLFHFQSKLTGETVVLDISSVKWVRLARLTTRDNQMYNSVRLQIWHEPRSRRTMSSDVASFVTAGTALSGPLRERTVPNSSRLMVFLGRAEEYIHCFITDDIEVEQKDQTCVKLKPRRSSRFSTRNARPGIKARLESRKYGEPVGLDISGELYNPDIEAGFDFYKTFEIEFESSPSQVNFIQAWNDVMAERRKQRKKLAMIQEEMKNEAFTAKHALAIRT